jgi:dTDP-4-dehydrorhamnose reductase
MILLLGASGYIGQAFEKEIRRRNLPMTALSRRQLDYTRFELLRGVLASTKPTFLINAAGYTGKPNVDACESARSETLLGNALFPQTVAHACLAADIPWGHVSSGCIFSGAKIVENGASRIEKDLTRPELQALRKADPDAIRGYVETDEPNFTFEHPPCSFYSGTKALGERAIADIGQNYVWRLRMPFDEFDQSRNYLSKLLRYPRVYDNVNSLSHRFDFVRACLDLWDCRAPFGIYNVTNPGYVTTRQVVKMMQQHWRLNRDFEFWESDEEFYRVAAKTPRSNCVLDTAKLLAAGVKMRDVKDAVEYSLKQWKVSGESPT